MPGTSRFTIWPPFAAGAGAAPGPVTATFRQALRARLLAAEGLESLTDVYWSKTKVEGAYPYIVLWRGGGHKRQENSSRSYWARRFVQVNVYADDDETCEALGEAAYDALEWDPAEPLLFTPGYEMVRFLDDYWDTGEEPGIGPGGADEWDVHFDCEFHIGRTRV